MQRPGEAGDGRGAGSRVGGQASRQRDGRAVLPDARVRASETERQSESELVVEAPRFLERPETWWTWVVDSNDVALFDGGSLHARFFDPGVVAGGRLRVPAGGAVGVKPATDPVKRIMVNVGSAPRAPGCWWQPGKARCRLMRTGRGGVRVVVRAAPRGAIRKEMKDIKHLVRAGWNAGPGLMQRPGEAGDGRGVESRAGGQASRQRDGRAALPDARVRASETER